MLFSGFGNHYKEVRVHTINFALCMTFKVSGHEAILAAYVSYILSSHITNLVENKWKLNSLVERHLSV